MQQTQLNHKDRNGNTPLHLACSGDYPDIANLLVKTITISKQIHLLRILNENKEQPNLQILCKYPSYSDKIFINSRLYFVNFDILKFYSDYFKNIFEDFPCGNKNEIQLSQNVPREGLEQIFELLFNNHLNKDENKLKACLEALPYFLMSKNFILRFLVKVESLRALPLINVPKYQSIFNELENIEISMDNYDDLQDFFHFVHSLGNFKYRDLRNRYLLFKPN